MKLLRIFFAAAVLALGNMPFFMIAMKLPVLCIWLLLIFLGIWFFVFQWIPVIRKGVSVRIQILSGSYELIFTAAAVLLSECMILLIMGLGIHDDPYKVPMMLFCGILTFILVMLCALNGALRVIIASRQTKLFWKICLLLTMWIPLWNFILAARVLHYVRREYITEANLQRADSVRKENEVCRTVYPIVMVHGIFFRDWQLMNYWGRIPYELIKNGASVYYGNQESALPVAESAKEVKRQIEEVLKASGAPKVNIIAHSKGGLDTRYAISQLGMAPYVASLTTVNTPHYGCIWAENVMKKLPEAFVQFAAQKYNNIFRRLGDKSPDFYQAVQDLTAGRCAELNKLMPDAEGVYFQSVMSIMKKRTSAGLPLNLVYPLVRNSDGDNDGLVSVTSAQWGNFLGVLECQKKRGISHADMIDLMRENIEGFDVREFYINLVKGLKERGL